MKNFFLSHLKSVLSALFLLGLSNNATATHYAGTDLFYESTGANQYKVTLVFYRDCGGVQEPTSAGIVLTNLCTGNNSVHTITKKPNSVSFVNGEEITSVCTGLTSACNGGTVPGLRKWVYEGVINLPYGTCTDWKISYQLCCRNFAITTLQNPGGESLYTEAVFKSNIQDNAPLFSNNPIAFACANQPFSFNQGAYDADGDSIAYELDNPLSAGGNPVVFAPGYSKDIPFASSNGFMLDSVSGGISFTPNSIQVGVFALKVNQYRNGNIIGYVRRDMEIFITNCNANTLPVLSGFNGTSNFSVNVCADDQFCASISSFDSDSNQSVTINWNQGIANATFIKDTFNHPTANICWTPAASDTAANPHVFTITVKDDACPSNGMQTFSYVINVIAKPVISITKTNTTCNGNNGSAVVSILSGNVSSLLWSNGLTTSGITSLAPGNYTVTVTNLTGCTTSSSIIISSVTGNLNITGSTSADNGSCNGMVNLNVNSGTAPYFFNWSDGSTLQSLSNVCAGNYSVIVTDANGCSGIGSYNVALNSGGCKITLAVTTNNTGQCNQGGKISVVPNGNTGKGVAILTNSSGIMVAQKNFQKTIAFDALYHDTYTINVTDANGCTASSVAVISVGGCGMPINVQVVNVTANSAKVKWDDCGAVSHVVRYKIAGSNNPFSYITVNNINEVLLPKLTKNKIYTVSVKSLCMQGLHSQYTIPKKFCTGNCIAPREIDETDLSDNESESYISAFDVMPNPAKDIIHIVGETTTDKTVNVIVTNLLGKVIKVQSAFLSQSFDLTMDINSLPQGIYIINVEGFENCSKRIVKI